jgi:hypothetical protein
MEATNWSAIVSGLIDPDIHVCVKAAERLQAETDMADVPNLLKLLESNDFFVREAAAWPLAELTCPKVLVQLLAAYQRGFDEGHDNDAFTAALLEIPALHSTEARLSLERVISSSEEPMRGHAAWLLEFCEPEGEHKSDDA